MQAMPNNNSAAHTPSWEIDRIPVPRLLKSTVKSGYPELVKTIDTDLWDGKVNSTIPKLDQAISTVFAEEIRKKLEKPVRGKKSSEK